MSTLRAPHHLGQIRASQAISVINLILDGKPWTAASIKNNCLRAHGRILRRTFLKAPRAVLNLKPNVRSLLGIIAQRSELLTRVHPQQLGLVPAVLRLAAYADRWLRPAHDWIPHGSEPLAQWRSLLRHLFQAYPLPESFDSAWLTFGDLQHVERDWYCHLGAGKSARTAPGMPLSATARALHLMMQAPAGLTIRQSLRWGQAQAVGCKPWLTQLIIESAMVNDLSNDRLWVRLMEKVQAARHFKRGNWSLLVDGVHHVVALAGGQRAARLLDLPLRDLQLHCRRIFEQLYELVQQDGGEYQRATLKKSGFRRSLSHIAAAQLPIFSERNFHNIIVHRHGDRLEHYVFLELTNLNQLQTESLHLRHCVRSYYQKCQCGQSAIFSLRTHSPDPKCPTTRHLTLEVNRCTKKIVQVRGKWNRYPRPHESQVIAQWATLNGLQI